MPGPHSVTPFAWDPKNPACLHYVAMQESERGSPSNTNAPAVILQPCSFFKACGCSDPELAALEKMIQANQEFYEEFDHRLVGDLEACKQLSQQYRAAVRECLCDMQRDDDTMMETEDDTNLELLIASYTVMHISDIFLPLIPASMGFYVDHESPWNQPGKVTAEMVRYLRIQHTPRLNEGQYEEIRQARQPEGYDKIYWNLVEEFVVRGCLEQAWDLLSRHSMYQLALEKHHRDSGNNDQYLAKLTEETRHAFETVREIMSRAPLPGGRNRLQDLIGSLGYPENETYEDVDFYSEDLPVRPSDFRLWEATGTTMSSMYILSNKEIMDKYRTWQEYVKMARSNLHFGRVPELRRLLAIMAGDFTEYVFDNWSDAFLADLLYRKPDFRPRDLSKRAVKFIKEYNPHMLSTLQPIICIMEGNAVQSINLLHVLGGASGAALPATMNALIYCLFIESHILTAEDKTEQTNYLCEAASAIVASIKDPSVAVSLAASLLLPYAMYEGNRTILACICELIGHHCPQSDDEATSLLSLLRPLVEMKSVYALETCVSIILARYRQHIVTKDFEMSTRWLLIGIELEQSLHQPGSCHRTLTSQCLNIATDILQGTLGETRKVDLDYYLSAKQMTGTLKNVTSGMKMETIPEMQVLFAVIDIYEKLVDNEHVYAFPSKEILQALQSTTDLSHQARSTVAQPRMYSWLLRIAHAILKSEETEGSADISSFGKEGLLVLSQTLMLMEASPSDSKLDVVEMEKLVTNARCRVEVVTNKMMKERQTLSQWEAPEYSQIRSIDIASYGLDAKVSAVKLMLDF